MKKAIIIGAGASGLAIAKTFKAAGIEFDVIEKGSKIGGLWRYKNDNGLSAAYRSLHINTNKEVMAFSDFPMPKELPMFPHHSQIVEYFESYAEHFGLNSFIKFSTSVEEVKKTNEGYELILSNGELGFYEYVIVANGHHWNPKFPDPPFPGEFTGEVLHSHDYRVPSQLSNKDILIVGIGNSAVDIACEVARQHTGRVTISTRSGAYIIPNWIWSMPFDNLANPLTSRLPLCIQRLLLKTALWLARGKQSDYGVPVPNRPLLSEHPTLSQDLLNLTGRGLINFKSNIASFNGSEVTFEDGSVQSFDTIVYATGYQVSFPFLKAFPSFQVADNAMDLYHNVISPDEPNLLFAGLIQPLGAIMPLVEVQGRWMSKIIKKSCELPSREKMYLEINKQKRKLEKRYKKSARHTLQVDFYEYKRRLTKEMRD